MVTSVVVPGRGRSKVALTALKTTVTAALFVNTGVVNRWYRLSGLIYQAWNDGETRNMELAVLPDDFEAFLRVLRSVEAAFQKQTGKFATYFTGRYTGGSPRTLIGPNHVRDVIFVDVHVRKGPGAQAFLVELERQLNEAIAVRPHWGKEFAMQRRHLLRAWPAGCWAAFAAAKNRYDPDNVFSNAYTQWVFGW